MNKREVFPIASDADIYVTRKQPSKYIPFKGKFPLLEPNLYGLYQQEIRTKIYIDDCSPWVQEVVIKAENIKTIDEGFQEYLRYNGVLNSFFKLKNSEKADWLVKFLNANCLTLDAIQGF